MDNRNSLHRLYLGCYLLGSIGTIVLLALLFWVAVCIFLEKEPLAAVSFLPHMPSFAILIVIAILAIITVFFWNKGAAYHQRYEELETKEGKS